MKLKKLTQTVVIAGLCAYALPILADDDKSAAAKKEDAHAHDDHDHEKIIAGPNGGRVLTSVEPHLEFFVTKEGKVQITALDDDNKPAKIEKQTVKIVAGDRKNPTKMSFEEKDGVLISDVTLPKGNDYPIVIQIKTSKLAKSVNEKFNLNLVDCPSCDYKEYACTCDHGHDHDGHAGHDHAADEKKK